MGSWTLEDSWILNAEGADGTAPSAEDNRNVAIQLLVMTGQAKITTFRTGIVHHEEVSMLIVMRIVA